MDVVLAEFSAWVCAFLARFECGAGVFVVFYGSAFDPDEVWVWSRLREREWLVCGVDRVGLCGMSIASIRSCEIASRLLVFG